VVDAPIERHPVRGLIAGAWARRHQLRLADALYVELAVVRGSALVTTDRRLGAVPMVDVVVA
jgi:predicted nucleic acid-binding protein